MSAEIKRDMSCVPYPRKGLYFVLTVPLLVLFILVFLYLWTFSFILSMVLPLFYLAMCYLQAYCCAYQGCPYVGGFCPAVLGIMPASLLAKLVYSEKKVKSKKWFGIQVALASVCWLGLIAFPLFWVAKLGTSFALGYLFFHALYYLIFGLTICPVCAIRGTCPGGKLQRLVLKHR